MQDTKEKAAVASIAVTLALAIAKLVAALLTGSLALLSDALQSLIDVGSTVMTLFSVRLSAKPADEEHTYGHGKVESITALIEVGLLIATSVYVVIEAAHRLIAGGEPPVFSWVVIGVLVIAVVIDFVRARSLRRIARETQSHALESNALHFMADMWQSLVVLAGFALVASGFPLGDALAALVVAALIVVAALGLGRRTVDVLMDAAPEGATETMRQAAERVRGVVSVERVRARTVGPRTIGEVTVAVARTLTPERIAALTAEVEHAIEAALPGADATVKAEPRALDDESVLERVLVIAAKRRTPVHHVTVQQIEGRLAVALDIEVDGRMSLGSAHAVASRLETAIRDEFGPEIEVETHIEPLEPHGLPGREVDEASRAEVARTIVELARDNAVLGSIHDVRVRETEKGRIVVLHCLADPKSTVAEVHDAVDALERAIRRSSADILRVLTHAEPRR
jgi:cation diffusion facilitator family transporter